jgi:hypothetical protein
MNSCFELMLSDWWLRITGDKVFLIIAPVVIGFGILYLIWKERV